MSRAVGLCNIHDEDNWTHAGCYFRQQWVCEKWNGDASVVEFSPNFNNLRFVANLSSFKI